MKRFFCLLFAVALTLASVCVMYPSLLYLFYPREDITALMARGGVSWDEAALGLESFPMYGSAHGDSADFYGVKQAMDEIAVCAEKHITPDITGYIGKITANNGFLQALYSFLVLALLSIPVYMVLRLAPYNTLHRALDGAPLLIRLPLRGLATLSCGVVCVCVTWVGYNTLVFKTLISKLVSWLSTASVPTDIALSAGNIVMILLAVIAVIAVAKTTLFRGSFAVSVLLSVLRTLLFIAAFAFINTFSGRMTPRVILYAAIGVIAAGIIESIFDR